MPGRCLSAGTWVTLVGLVGRELFHWGFRVAFASQFPLRQAFGVFQGLLMQAVLLFGGDLLLQGSGLAQGYPQKVTPCPCLVVAELREEGCGWALGFGGHHTILHPTQ